MCKVCERSLIVNAVTVLSVGIFLSGCATTQGNLPLPYERTVEASHPVFRIGSTDSIIQAKDATMIVQARPLKGEGRRAGGTGRQEPITALLIELESGPTLTVEIHLRGGTIAIQSEPAELNYQKEHRRALKDVEQKLIQRLATEKESVAKVQLQRAGAFLSWFLLMEPGDQGINLASPELRSIRKDSRAGDPSFCYLAIHDLPALATYTDREGVVKSVLRQVGPNSPRQPCMGRCGEWCKDDNPFGKNIYHQLCHNHDECNKELGGGVTNAPGGPCYLEFILAASPFMFGPDCWPNASNVVQPHRECPSGQRRCSDRTCRSTCPPANGICANTSQCLTHEVCFRSRCVPRGRDDCQRVVDCPQGLFCVEGSCVAPPFECRTTEDCGDMGLCIDNLCIER